MNWLHCNKCGVTATSKTDFFCGSCAHVLCSKCNLQTCPIDKRPFKGIKINPSMPQNLRAYFEDPNKLLAQWQKCIRFQFEQRTLCEPSHFSGTLKQIRRYKEETKLLMKAREAILENTTREVKRCNKIKAYLKNYVRNRTQSDGTSRASAMKKSLNFSSVHGESGVDLQFDELDYSN